MSKTISSCSPPSCSCFELEVYDDIDGNKMVAITDGTNGVAIDSKESFDLLVANYITEVLKGKI